MRRAFHLPDLGSGLQEGEIVAWRVAVGDEVSEDQVLCEIETEKAVVEIPVPFAGRVVELGAAEGESIRVGSVLVVIDDGKAEPAPESAPAPPAAKPAAETVAPAAAPPGPQAPPSRPLAMPLVRRLAKEHGVDLATVPGTGVGGRITRKDVERAIEARRAAPAPEPATAAGDTRVRLSALRRRIAAHMTRSWTEIPHVFTTIDTDAGRLLEVRRALSDRLGTRLPLETFVMLAVVPVLRSHPELNATLDGDELVLHGRHDLGFAVDTPDGLIVPVVRGVGELSLAALAGRIVDLAARTRERKVEPDELTGATFTVNNIGALGRAAGTSIIPSGTTGILSFGRAIDRAVVRDGKVVARPVMSVNLAFDHRVVDGGTAAAFLEELAILLEEPTRFLVP